MPTTQNTVQTLHNDLLHAQLAAAFDSGDMEAARKLSAMLDAQQLLKVRKSLPPVAANQ